jgi:hypothetical protein
MKSHLNVFLRHQQIHTSLILLARFFFIEGCLVGKNEKRTERAPAVTISAYISAAEEPRRREIQNLT